jgi:hypothetical protein
LLPVLGEVFLRVINHVIGADRAHQFQLPRAIDARHFGPQRLGELHCERARATSRAVDQHPLSGLDLAFVAKPLQGDECRLRHGGRLLEAHAGRLQHQRVFGSACVLSQTAPTPEDVAKHFIAWPKLLYALSDGFHPPGDVRSKHFVLGFEEPPHADIGRRACQGLPVRRIEGNGMNLDQDFVVAREWLFDLLQLHDIGGAISAADSGFHLRFSVAYGRANRASTEKELRRD